MTKYLVREIVRVLVVVRVEAKDEQEALEEAEGRCLEFLPEDTENSWLMGAEGGSRIAEEDNGKTAADIGWDILEEEEG